MITAKKTPRSNLEDQIHIGIVQYLTLMARDWIWYHVPNGEYRSKSTGAKLKRLGVRAGVPDLNLVSPTGRIHYLEIKAPKGVLSASQRDFRDDCERKGIPYEIARSTDEAQRIFNAWGVGKKVAA